MKKRKSALLEERGRTMSKEVSTLRLYLMRALYLLNFALGLLYIWPGLIRHEGLSDPLQAVAISFWAALFTLSGLGLRYPLKMLPLLFMQLFYKSVWLIAVGLPLWRVGRSADLTGGMVMGVVLDLIAIPWPYVWANYVKEHGDRWR
jgi:hypothetical protein